MDNLEPRRRVLNLQDWANVVQLHMVPAIDRRAFFSTLHKADESVGEVLGGIEMSLLPDVAIGEVEEVSDELGLLVNLSSLRSFKV